VTDCYLLAHEIEIGKTVHPSFLGSRHCAGIGNRLSRDIDFGMPTFPLRQNRNPFWNVQYSTFREHLKNSSERNEICFSSLVRGLMIPKLKFHGGRN
jgi:hypothetical protein